jgi:hypothetical protein
LQCGDGPWIGVKATIATTLHRSKVGQFIAHAKALPGNPHDGPHFGDRTSLSSNASAWYSARAPTSALHFIDKGPPTERQVKKYE